MYRLSFLVLFIAFTGCVGVHEQHPAPEQKALAANYPFSEVEAVYDAVFDGMTEKYFAKFPEMGREHTAAMRAYIVQAYPRTRFVEEMVRDQYRPILERGMRELAYRQSKEFKDAFQVVIGVAVPMARMIIGGQRDIYVAKFVDKNPVRVELLKIATTEDEQQYASWTSEEVSGQEVEKEMGAEYTPQSGDHIYAFCSPPDTWENLCGRQGYLIVRDGKIVRTVVTMLN